MGIFNNIFSSSKLSDPADYSILKVDLHSHLIPGLDDGSSNIEESIEMVRRFHKLGFEKLITTPHIMNDYYRNTPDRIKDGLQELRKAVEEAGIPISIEAAAEYMIDDGFEKKLSMGNLLTIGDKYLLIELSTFTPHPNLHTILFNLQLEGYKIILAHAERYSYWYKDFTQYENLKHREMYFQVNTLSFGGFYNPGYRKMAEKLSDAGLIDFLGSDMHHLSALTLMEKSAYEKHVVKLINSGNLLNNKLL